MRIQFQHFIKAFVILSFVSVSCKNNHKNDNTSLDLLNKSSKEVENNYRKLSLYFIPKLVDSSFILTEINIKGTIFENRLGNTYKLFSNKDIKEIHVYSRNFITFTTETKDDYTTKWYEKLIVKCPNNIEQLKKTLINNSSKITSLKKIKNYWYEVIIAKNLD